MRPSPRAGALLASLLLPLLGGCGIKGPPRPPEPPPVPTPETRPPRDSPRGPLPPSPPPQEEPPTQPAPEILGEPPEDGGTP